jgi:VIT1/CCC1 family predicted Fe2+/Mn2+ transporter
VATDDRLMVLIAGIATRLAGIFSVAAGEFLSSKSQREIAVARIAEKREKVAGRRGEVQAELSYMLLIGAFAGVVGYFFGSILPTLLGAPAVGG